MDKREGMGHERVSDQPDQRLARLPRRRPRRGWAPDPHAGAWLSISRRRFRRRWRGPASRRRPEPAGLRQRRRRHRVEQHDVC